MELTGKSIDEIVEYYKGKSILIVGNGKTVFNQATGKRFDYSEAFDHIWTVNGGWLYHESAELGFMMDDLLSPAHDSDLASRDVKVDRLLNHTKIPIFTCTAYKDFPCLIEYPLLRVVRETGRAYFAETISYVLAFAIMCQVSEIHLQGTDYHGCKAAERACSEHWAAIAVERGISISTNPYSHFLNTQLDERNNHVPSFYGYIKETFPMALQQKEDGTWTLRTDITREDEIQVYRENYSTKLEELRGNKIKN